MGEKKQRMYTLIPVKEKGTSNGGIDGGFGMPAAGQRTELLFHLQQRIQKVE